MESPADSGLRSTRGDDYQAVPRAVAAMAKEFADGAQVPPHRHVRAQLLYASRGVMRIASAAAAWTVPPLRAVWIPAGLEHWIRMAGPVSMRTLYIAADAAPWLWPRPRVLAVSPLLRALILSAAQAPTAAPADARAQLMMALILIEIRTAAPVPVELPMPVDRRALAVAQALLADPGNGETIEAWAERAGASGRTLARRFVAETGLSFSAWRQQARLAEAVSRMAVGQPLAAIARALGYASPSAFAAMFRRALGEAPHRYFRGLDADDPAP